VLQVKLKVWLVVNDKDRCHMGARDGVNSRMATVTRILQELKG